MLSLSEQIAGLEKHYAAPEQQRVSLQKQMEQVATRLTKIRAMFEATAPKGGTGGQTTPPLAPKATPQAQKAKASVAKAQAPKRSPARKPQARSKSAKAVAKRAWFEPGEAAALIRKAIKKPMKQTELVQALADAKGYTGKLSKDEYKSFQGAAFVGIAQAVKARVLSKAADGSVSPRSA